MDEEFISKVNSIITANYDSFSEADVSFRLIISDEVKKQLDELGFQYEERRHIEIPAKVNDLYIFDSIVDFQRRVVTSNIDFSNSNLIILNHESPDEFCSWNNGETTDRSENKNNQKIFEVANTYIDFREFLIQLHSDDEMNGSFLEYYNHSNDEVLLASYSEKGKIKVKTPKHLPGFDFKQSPRNSFDKFKDAFSPDSRHLPSFIKNELIIYLGSANIQSRIIKWFEIFETIIDSARLNFNVYLHNLSIDSIKREYKEYKNKYFENYNSIGSKIASQIIALPIAIIGIGLAIEKLVSPEMLISLSVVIVLFNGFLGAITIYFRGDLKFLSKAFSDEYNRIISNNFFEEFPDEQEDFKSVKDLFNSKTTRLDSYLIFYCLVSFLFYDFLTALSLHKAGINLISICIVELVIVGTQFIFTLSLEKHKPEIS